MKWISFRVDIETANCPAATEVVAEFFREHGIRGVVIEDPTEEGSPDWADALPVYRGGCSVTGYLPENDRIPERWRIFRQGIQDLGPRISARLRVRWNRLDEEDWADSWKAHFHPIRIGERIVICPSWREFDAAPDDRVLIIDPGMAFGTGSHPTTALCIELLETYLPPGCRFLDIGTGSGILLMTAGILGAARMVGVDNDETALAVARKNLSRNGIENHAHLLVSGNLGDCIRGGFDVVCANILTHVILELLPHIPGRLNPGGMFLGSGILAAHADRVADRIQALGMQIVEMREKDEWLAVVAKLGENAADDPIKEKT